MRLQLQAIHIPGVTNTFADRLSRIGTLREYYLKETLFHEVTEILQFVPEEDAFAAAPYLPSETAIEHPAEALRASWKGRKLFLHPPMHLVTRTIAKADREEVEAILIVPNWKAQPWSSTLARLERKEVVLGTFEDTMTTTPRFRSEGWLLPPGDVRAVLLAGRTTRESASSGAF
jgi:hypothetical protein